MIAFTIPGNSRRRSSDHQYVNARTGWRAPLLIVALLLVATALAACGSDGADSTAGTADGEDAELSGITRPEPLQVGEVTVPDATTGGEGGDFAMRATPGELLVVYFGYTSCPDICPTTLADLRTAFEQVGPAAETVDVAMVTVDPERDTGPKLSNYLSSFFDRYHALREPDLERIAEIEEPFGASSSVVHQDDGRVEVGHSAITYVVDDTGAVLVEWPFGTEPDAMASDLEVLLERQQA